MTVEIYLDNSLVLSHEFQPRVTGLTDTYSAACGYLELTCVEYNYTDSGRYAGSWFRHVRIVATANAGYTYQKYRLISTYYRPPYNPVVFDDEYRSNIYTEAGTNLGEMENYNDGVLQDRRENYVAFYFQSRTYTHLPLRDSSGNLLRNSSGQLLRDG